jgi:nucleotide-binding universal stress UspA family protein
MTIHVSPSTGQDPSTNPPEGARRSIVVGVDPGGRSVSALVWAAEEAQRDGTTLHLVSARPDGEPSKDPAGEHDLSALARRLTMSEVEKREVVGSPVQVLLGAAAEADLLAVGCRCLGPAQRMLLGSTSRAVACWAPVPVVIVPEAWIQPTMATAPLVAGVRPAPLNTPSSAHDQDREVLDFAFARADALKVPLVVVSAWEIPTAYAWSPEDIERLRSEHDASLTARLAPWRDAHPQVEVVARNVAEQPDRALLHASEVAQMVVVGRHHSTMLSGTLGGTARGVLHRASRPVVVVPAGTREEVVRELDARRTAEAAWAPTF